MNSIESQTVEWKQAWHDEHLKWVCAFANTDGGTLEIGKDDKGSVVPLADIKELLEQLPNKIRQGLGIVADVRLAGTKSAPFVSISVPKYSNPISYRGHYYRRLGTTQEIAGHALDDFILQRSILRLKHEGREVVQEFNIKYNFAIKGGGNMKVKDYYNADCAALLSQKIKTVFSDFNEKAFIKYVDKNVADKEFSERMEVFANAFELYLTENYENNIKIFEQILGQELQQETGMFSEWWWLWPVGRYVERHGIRNVKISLDFIKELTKRFTGEYAIRPLLTHKPNETITTMVQWSKDENVHVRRLASEGVRISLPWSKKIYIAIDEFEQYKIILTNLKNDKSKFVQKSVGNNLNDLYKEFPEKANEIINEWKMNNPTKETMWIINHGLRSIKKDKKSKAHTEKHGIP